MNMRHSSLAVMAAMSLAMMETSPTGSGWGSGWGKARGKAFGGGYRGILGDMPKGGWPAGTKLARKAAEGKVGIRRGW